MASPAQHVIFDDSIDALADVDTTTAAPTLGQILTWDGSNWTPAVPGDDDFRAISAADGSTVTFAGDKRTDGKVGIGRDPTTQALEVAGDIHYTTNLYDSSQEPGNNKTNINALLVASYGSKTGRVLENQGAVDAWMGPRMSFQFRVPAGALQTASTENLYQSRCPHEMTVDEVQIFSLAVNATDVDVSFRINTGSDLLDDGAGNNYLTIPSGSFAPVGYFRDNLNLPVTGVATIVVNAGTGLLRRGDLVGVGMGTNFAPDDDLIVSVMGRLLETPYS
jgi:hypothetical protein